MKISMVIGADGTVLPGKGLPSAPASCPDTACPYYQEVGAGCTCRPKANVVTATVGGNTCRGGFARAGYTRSGDLICVQCSPGYAPDPTSQTCVPYTPAAAATITPDVLPWLEKPMRQSMKLMLLPASFYKHGLYSIGSAQMTTADGRKILVNDHRHAEGDLTGALSFLNPADREEFTKHQGDSKYRVPGWKVWDTDLISVKDGRLPWMTWEDPLTKVKVGAFRSKVEVTPMQLVIKPWDPYTASDLWDDITGALCAVVSNPATQVAAPVTAAAYGLPPQPVTMILEAAQSLCGGTTASGEVIPPTVPHFPSGTIHTYENGIWRVAIPVVTSGTRLSTLMTKSKALVRPGELSGPRAIRMIAAATLSPEEAALVTHQESTPSATDPATRGSTAVDAKTFCQKTGSCIPWYKDWRYLVPIGLGVSAAAVGGALYYRKRRSGR